MQERIIGPFLDWVSYHQDWAGPVAFLLAFTESLPVVGLFIPGSALLFAAGMLIVSGTLPAWPVLLGAGLGAALGDSTGYVMARRCKSEQWLRFCRKYSGNCVSQRQLWLGTALAA